MTTLVFVAHPDDEVLGCGGTIAKLSKEGEKVIVVIFSHGEGSDPLIDPAILTEKRIKESKRAASVLGVRDIIFLGLSDLKFKKEIKELSTTKKVLDILRKYRPKTIFTHTADDPHPAHRAIANLIRSLTEELKLKTNIYTFMISSPFRLLNRESPRLYIDVSKTHRLKEKALSMFKSQRKWVSIYYAPLIWLRDWFAGFKAGCKFAEVFYKW